MRTSPVRCVRAYSVQYRVIEEAVSAVETDTRGAVSLVMMFVCRHCTRAVSGSRRLKAGAAPEHSMAALDYGRRYLSPRTVDRLRGSLRDTHSEYPRRICWRLDRTVFVGTGSGYFRPLFSGVE
eukprot:SAG25_NODE_5771_length_622_cov_1.177820_2_plen_124_part_00